MFGWKGGISRKIYEWIALLIRNIPTETVGIRLRHYIYKKLLKSLGEDTKIYEGVILISPERIAIGSHCTLNPSCYLAGKGGIEIGDYVHIAAYVGIFSFNHIYEDPTRPIALQGSRREKVNIGNDIWIGSGVTVLSGVSIGNGSVVGAGSVVVDDVPPYSVVAGVPAQLIKKRNGKNLEEHPYDPE